MNDDEMEFSDPNGSAYKSTEQRTGVPLGYISEKMKGALKMVHVTLSAIKYYVPDDLPQPEKAKGTSFNVKQDALLIPAISTFRYQLTSFLALHNMLAVANDQKVFERLQQYTPEEFAKWLEHVEQEGALS